MWFVNWPDGEVANDAPALPPRPCMNWKGSPEEVKDLNHGDDYYSLVRIKPSELENWHISSLGVTDHIYSQNYSGY